MRTRVGLTSTACSSRNPGFRALPLPRWWECGKLRQLLSWDLPLTLGVLPNLKLQASPKQLQKGARPHEEAERTVVVNLAVPLDAFTAYFGQLHSEDSRMAPTTGTIKRITDRGFGFIAAPDGVEYFFHQSACTSTPIDSMREGDSVTFTLGQGPKGPRAENVTPA